MKNLKESQARFEKIDGANFGACLHQAKINAKTANPTLIEWRIRNTDGKLCIIQFYSRNAGYSVFVQETNEL